MLLISRRLIFRFYACLIIILISCFSRRPTILRSSQDWRLSIRVSRFLTSISSFSAMMAPFPLESMPHYLPQRNVSWFSFAANGFVFIQEVIYMVVVFSTQISSFSSRKLLSYSSPSSQFLLKQIWSIFLLLGDCSILSNYLSVQTICLLSSDFVYHYYGVFS